MQRPGPEFYDLSGNVQHPPSPYNGAINKALDTIVALTAERDQLAAQVAACGDAGCPSARENNAARRYLAAQAYCEEVLRRHSGPLGSAIPQDKREQHRLFSEWRKAWQ